MPKLTKKTTICFEPQVLEYLHSKAAEKSSSISDVIHEALGLLASDDAEDVADFDARIGEPNVGYAEFVQSLKADGIIWNRLQAVG
jgi:hypothetical protein